MNNYPKPRIRRLAMGHYEVINYPALNFNNFSLPDAVWANFQRAHNAAVEMTRAKALLDLEELAGLMGVDKVTVKGMLERAGAGVYPALLEMRETVAAHKRWCARIDQQAALVAQGITAQHGPARYVPAFKRVPLSKQDLNDMYGSIARPRAEDFQGFWPGGYVPHPVPKLGEVEAEVAPAALVAEVPTVMHDGTSEDLHIEVWKGRVRVLHTKRNVEVILHTDKYPSRIAAVQAACAKVKNLIQLEDAERDAKAANADETANWMLRHLRRMLGKDGK